MEMDIRESTKVNIESIRFADEPDSSSIRYATRLVTHWDGYFYMEDEDDDNSIRFDDAEQVRNCIIALQKALDLGWVK